MDSFKTLVKKHPVVIYCLVTVGISWGGLICLLGGPGAITSQPASVPFLPLYFVTVGGPSIAGIILTGFYDGKKGYRAFFARLITWRVEVRWYTIALLIAPVTVFAALFVLSLFSPVFLPGILKSGDNPIALMFGLPGSDKMTLFLFVLMLGCFNGFIEEIGWTGFATPKLRSGHTLFVTGLYLGIFWGIWHFLSNYIGSAASAGTVPLPMYMLVILLSFLPPFRILMTWVYDHTKSLFIAILMHACLDIFWILATPYELTGQQRIIWYLVWAALLWSIVALVFIAKRKHQRVSNGSSSRFLPV